MNPLRIEITNFGAIPYADIDLTGITLAAITGRNGAGKSTAFTIAPMFALFGTTKNGCSQDDMVRTGTQEAAVTFEFEHRGVTYRVIRTRSTKGKGKSTLELQRMDEGQWVSESGTTIRETEEKIKDLLNLDGETFAASSMILQGKANEFTAKPPGQRKAILAQVLGLDIYERLQDAAKEKASKLNVELEKAKTKLADLQERIKELPTLREQEKEYRADVELSEAIIEKKETELAGIDKRLAELKHADEQMRKLTDRIGELQRQIAEAESQKSEFAAKLDKAKKMLEAEEQILAKADEYERVKEQVVVLRSKVPRLQELEAEVSRIERDIGRVDKDIADATSKITRIEMELANAEKYQQAADEYKNLASELENEEAKAQQYQDIRTELNNLTIRLSKEEAALEREQELLQREIERCKKQTDIMKDANCIDLAHAACKFLSQAKQDEAKIAELEAKLQGLDRAKIEAIQAEIDRLKREEAAIGYDPERLKQIKERMAALRTDAEKAAQLDTRRELLVSLQESKQKAENARAEYEDMLRAAKANSQKLSGELEPLDLLETRLPKLEQWKNAKDQLPAAKQIAETAAERIDELDKRIHECSRQIDELTEEKEMLERDSSLLPEIDAQAQNLRRETKRLREGINALLSKIGATQAKIESLTRDEEERKRVAKELEPLSRDLVRYQTLIKAFGKDGIPALIIENAVPELERIANEILGQMSNGKHAVRFETQRELKSRDGVAETLDIMVSDWYGERPYETFSGGEQLRIDFAIRFALAEMLARRAGSKVEWLTIDEGLGSQDAHHRGLVLEAIKNVAHRFKKVLVITHVEEAQAAFEQRIYFEPTENGVEVSVA